MEPTGTSPGPIVVPAWVTEVIDRLEASAVRSTETEIAGAFRAAMKGREAVSQDDKTGWWCEVAAFSFCPVRESQAGPWGTHFGPQATFTRADGKIIHVPDILEVDQRVIAYWQRRAGMSKDPVARARYADLVWDFKRKVGGAKPDVLFARTAIDSYREASSTYRDPDGTSDIERVQWLERALQLSKQIHDRGRIAAIRDEMFDLFETSAQPQMVGTWDFIVHRCLEDRGVGLTEQQRARVITFLEDGLTLVADVERPATFSPRAARAIAERLARVYQQEGKLPDVERVIRTAGTAFEALAAKANALQAAIWLQDQHDIYRSRGMNEDAAKVKARLKEVGTMAITEMPILAVPVSISAEELKGFGAQIVEGDLAESLERISGRFIPSVALVRKHMETMDTEAPLISRIPVGTMADGQFVARTGSVEEDPEGRLRLEIIKFAAIDAPWLRAATDALLEVKRPSAEQLKDYVLGSPLAKPERGDLILQGLKAYVDGDHVKAIHVLIPQIENVFRVLLKMQGATTSKAGRTVGTMQEMNWNDILVSPLIRSTMPEDLRLFLMSYFADPRGPNIRNRMSHGLMESTAFNRDTSDRVFHALIAITAWSRDLANDNQVDGRGSAP